MVVQVSSRLQMGEKSREKESATITPAVAAILHKKSKIEAALKTASRACTAGCVKAFVIRVTSELPARASEISLTPSSRIQGMSA